MKRRKPQRTTQRKRPPKSAGKPAARRLPVNGHAEIADADPLADARIRPLLERYCVLAGVKQTVIGAEHGLLDAGEHAVALQQRPDTGIGQRIGVGDLGMPVYGQTPSRGFTRALRGTLALGRPLRLSAFHAGSASMSTSASGR